MSLVNPLIVAILAVGLVKSEANNLIIGYYQGSTASPIRTDDYITIHKRQFNSSVENLELQIESFKELYTERLKLLYIQRDLLANAVSEIDRRLYPLEILSDFSKDCVKKHREQIPSVASARNSMQDCISQASNQLYSLLYSATSTVRNFGNYYKNNFEKLLGNCQKEKNEKNYTLCITSATAVANSYTQTNTRSFAIQIQNARVSAYNYINQAVDCSFAVQNRTIASITRASALIERCLANEDKCNDREGLYCKNVEQISLSLLEYKNQTIINPFYGRNESTKCLLLEVI